MIGNELSHPGQRAHTAFRRAGRTSHHSRLTIAITTIVLCASSCAGAGEPGVDAHRQLRMAIDRTLAVKDMHIEAWLAIRDEDFRSHGDYVAPDRFRMVTQEPTAATIIVIGRRHYVTPPGETDRFSLLEVGDDPTLAMFLPVLGWLEDPAVVRGDGDAFEFEVSLDGRLGPIEGTVRVEDGILASVTILHTLGGEKVRGHYEFSSFGGPSIEPPPGRRVTRVSGIDGYSFPWVLSS